MKKNLTWRFPVAYAFEQSRAEQSRAEQSRAEQNRAEQSRAEQSRAEQSRNVAGSLHLYIIEQLNLYPRHFRIWVTMS